MARTRARRTLTQIAALNHADAIRRLEQRASEDAALASALARSRALDTYDAPIPTYARGTMCADGAPPESRDPRVHERWYQAHGTRARGAAPTAHGTAGVDTVRVITPTGERIADVSEFRTRTARTAAVTRDTRPEALRYGLAALGDMNH